MHPQDPSRPLYLLPGSPRGGVARSAQRLLRHLTAQGIPVALCQPDPNLFDGDIDHTDRGLRFGANRDMLQRWTDHALALIKRLGDVNVVVGYYGTSGGFVAATVAALAGLPCVVALRGNDVDRDFFRGDQHALLRYAVTQATLVTTVSSEMAAKVKRLFGTAARFVPNGVDVTRFFPDSSGAAEFRARHGLGEARVVGLFGEFKPKRGLDRLAEWGDGLNGSRVMLVGRVRDAVVHHVPAGALRIGYLDDVAALRAAYCACDVVLQPSHHDGMPNVVLEAMACGRPVIASPVGGLPDIIEPDVNGQLCTDSADWRAALMTGPSAGWGTEAQSGVHTAVAEAQDHDALLAEVRRRYTARNASR